MGKQNHDLERQIEAVVKGEPTDECVEWSGQRDGDGLGVVRLRRWVKVHKVAYAKKYGYVPTGSVVVQQCGNKLCFNWQHLILE